MREWLIAQGGWWILAVVALMALCVSMWWLSPGAPPPGLSRDDQEAEVDDGPPVLLCPTCGYPVRPVEPRDKLDPADGFEWVHDNGPDIPGNPVCDITPIAEPPQNWRPDGSEP